MWDVWSEGKDELSSSGTMWQVDPTGKIEEGDLIVKKIACDKCENNIREAVM